MSASAAAQSILSAIRVLRDSDLNGPCVELLTTALDDVARVHQLNVQQAREITRLTRANDALNEQLHLVHTEQHALERSA